MEINTELSSYNFSHLGFYPIVLYFAPWLIFTNIIKENRENNCFKDKTTKIINGKQTLAK